MGCSSPSVTLNSSHTGCTPFPRGEDVPNHPSPATQASSKPLIVRGLIFRETRRRSFDTT